MSDPVTQTPAADEGLGRIADEQAALHRVARLVADGAESMTVFNTVCEEAGRLIGATSLNLAHYTPDGFNVTIAGWSVRGIHLPTGTRLPLKPDTVGYWIQQTSAPARIDNYEDATSELAVLLRDSGIRSAVAAPVVVDGQVWGALAAGTDADEPLPAGTEERLARFTELVVMAIANAQARDGLRVLADEQAALRRVATLVACESAPVEIFGAVTEEARRVLASEAVGLLRFEPDGTATLVAQSDTPWDPPPLGTRFTLDGENVVTQVFRSGETVRMDDWTDSTGAVAAMASVLGVRSAVASPVVVEGRLWGTIIAATSQDEPLPATTESRLAQFTALVATAIANAGARGQLSRLAEEQAALRRVAVLVAQQPSPVEVFAAVTEAVGPLLGADLAAMHVFRGGVATVVASWSQAGPTLPTGTELPLDGDSAIARIFRTGAAARIDGYADVEGETADVAKGLRLRTAVGAPILVEGKLWGALMAATRGEEPLPEDAEARIAAFTELVATAVSNAQAREELHGLAEEQAALRRVATLVAAGTAPGELFNAVAAEAAAVLGVSSSSVSRFLQDGASVVLASLNDPGFPVGSRWEPDEGTLNARVLETRRPVRIDQSSMSGAIAEASQLSDVQSVVGAPIVVEGNVWGMVAVGRQHSDEPLPADTEVRLTDFTELIATAISNTDARDGERRLAGEQAALRRVAEIVAREASPGEVFTAIAETISGLLDQELRMVRFEDDETAVAVANSDGVHKDLLPVGLRVPLGGNNVLSRVFRTGEAARIDDYREADGPIAEAVRVGGVRSAVATPIVVGNRLWGAMLVGTFGDEPLAPGAESWLGQFTELMATAISNAEARDSERRLAEEQAALRRVATLVAEDVPPAELFSAVSEEVERVFSGADPTLLASVIRFDPGPECVLVAASRPYEQEAVGSRWKPKELYVSTRVLRTGASARVDEAELEAAGGPDADVLRLRGFLYQVGTPVVVEGRLWGAMTLNSCEELPPDTDERLASFTELIATAIANAESHEALAELADEQAALRRVATLVAANPASEELFSAVAREAAGVLGVRGIILDRFEADGSQVTLGSWYDLELAGADAFLGVGVRLPLHPGTLAAAVFSTHRAARVENYSELEGMMGEAARAAGIGSGCAAPIIVDGRLWGQMCVFSGEGTVLPAGTEHRLDDFVQLVGTAISNYDARASLRTLADEQAALRRVATLVARDAPSEEVFAAVAMEVGKLLDTDITIVGRYDDDGYATAIGNWSASAGGVPAGTRSAIGGRNVLSLVAETGKPARMDAYDEATGEAAEIARRHGWGSSIAAPIVVEGRVWGVMLVATTREQPFPAGSEERLAAFTDLVATALANANVRSQLLESRARIVAAGDEARRRIERNLHDGTQQRLIALGLDIAAVRASVPEGQRDLDANLERLEDDVDEVLGEVRELSRGLHPGLLTRQGLGPALRALARKSSLPVSLEVDLAERPPEPVETATYFVVSEALTNAVKYAQASYLTVSISVDEAHLHATIADDGIGGAQPGAGAGSGLIGLLDRVNALGGRLELESPPGRGTTISIELPLAQ